MNKRQAMKALLITLIATTAIGCASKPSYVSDAADKSAQARAERAIQRNEGRFAK